MARMDQVGKLHTTVAAREGITSVTYHSTVVVEFNDKTIKLDTGGWNTKTTKVRMNQTSNQFGLGFRVFTKNFELFADFNGKKVPFDGDTLELAR